MSCVVGAAVKLTRRIANTIICVRWLRVLFGLGTFRIYETYKKIPKMYIILNFNGTTLFDFK